MTPSTYIQRSLEGDQVRTFLVWTLWPASILREIEGVLDVIPFARRYVVVCKPGADLDLVEARILALDVPGGEA